MENLKKLFEIRDSIFDGQTDEIFELISTSLICISEFLSAVDPMFDAGDLIWEELNLVDDMVVIIGMVYYEPGTTIEVENNLVSITEENLDYFQRVVHMSLPIDIVMSSNKLIISKFLQNLKDEGQGDDFTEIIKNAPDISADFDLSKLTPEQQQSLMFYNSKQKNSN